MQPMSSYSRRTSTPWAAFRSSTSRMLSQNTPGWMMKYSRKIYRWAFSSSASIRGKARSPREKYSVTVLV